MISVTAAGRTPHQKKRQTSAVVNIPKHISKKDISHVFRAVADAAPSEQAVVVTAFETEIDHLEDKPWRAEGADPSDWFNYGFNEETWRRYCEKQMRLRREYAMGGNPSIHQMQQPPQPMYPPQHHMQQQHPPFQQQMQAPRYDGPPLRGKTVNSIGSFSANGSCFPSIQCSAPSIYAAAHPSKPPRHDAGSRPQRQCC